MPAPARHLQQEAVGVPAGAVGRVGPVIAGRGVTRALASGHAASAPRYGAEHDLYVVPRTAVR